VRGHVCLLVGVEANGGPAPRYLITAPLSLRLDAVETVLLQLFGFTSEVKVYVFLKTSMAPDHVVLAQEVVTLNTQNRHQAAAKVRLYPGQLQRTASHVILHVQSAEINQHLSIPVSRTNGFLFIQTDKPLYTPHQSAVKVRAFSLNQELRPANRSVFLTFKDPDRITVDVAEMIDVNNGIPSMQNPFRIPIKPKLGIWSIEAAYSGDFTTAARTDFEVKEYVLPSFSILVKPEQNYISFGNFRSFSFQVSVRYLHGAPVADGVVFLRYGYVSGKAPAVLIPTSVSRERLSSTGEVSVTVNMEKVLSKHDGPRDLGALVGKHLYIAVLVQEDTGGISEEAEFSAVKFVKSPYRLSLVSTPPFIKPGLPYHISVAVKDHLDKPVKGVVVALVRRQLFRRGEQEEMPCTPRSTSSSSGIAFICNVPKEASKAALTVRTSLKQADPVLPAASQAQLDLLPLSYHSPNQRYLYIDPPLPGQGLEVGSFANINVYSATPTYIPVRALSFLVLSRGKVVDFGSVAFVSSTDHRQTLNFEVTPAMVPSVRLLVYYILFGEGTSELVADSVWLDVRDKCVNGLQVDAADQRQEHKPKDNLQMKIVANQDGLVALSARDSALFALRPNYKDPVSTVLRHLEQSDRGCGGGGGRDSADVFRLAGLTFLTNANAQAATSSDACTAATRTRRALSDEEKKKKAASSFGPLRSCCLQGMRFIPKTLSCLQLSRQRFHKHPRCGDVFRTCCEFVQQQLDQDQSLILGRHELGADFDQEPSLIRSYFPESWMWEVQRVSPGQTSLTRTLPDSLTTWDVQAVGMFQNGICVADPVQVSVSLPLSLDVPVPYQVVRGEQLELTGSVYNQLADGVTYCVTLLAEAAVCLTDSQPAPGRAGLRSTGCTWTPLFAGGVGKVAFTVLGLEPGEHRLTFVLKTRRGHKDILEKKLRVVPEGVRREQLSGGRLDPQGLYGSEKISVELRNTLPASRVPNTAVERMLTINGEVLDQVVSVVHSADGLRQLASLPAGSAEAELGVLLLQVQLYRYLETSRHWSVLGADIGKSSGQLKEKIRQAGLVSVSSFRRGDSSFSMWVNKGPSTWLTALVVKILAQVDPVVPVDRQALSESVAWLIRKSQQPDGSFEEPSSYRPNRIVVSQAAGAVDRSVFITSFVLIALQRATSINEPILQLRVSMRAAAAYISQHAVGVASVYVRAVATFALTLYDSNSMAASTLLSSLENLARERGHPAVIRYWQDGERSSEWLKPDQSSGVTVETTAYVLLSFLLKGRIHYANPVLTWLTQDHQYGGAFYSGQQDTALTLEALTEYSRVVPRAALSLDISVRYSRKGPLGRVQLSQSRPVATPIQVTKDDSIHVSTGYGTGVSSVKLKTVYYETTASTQRCNFDVTVEVVDPDTANNPRITSPTLVACAKFKPPPNELLTESGLTVMKIQLPTGVEPHLEDLKQFQDGDEPLVSHYELQGDTVVIQMDAVPSEVFVCVEFRVRSRFVVRGSSVSVLSIYEPQDKGTMCTKEFSYQEQKLQRLCVAEQCQCMAAACATYRGGVDVTLTAARRTSETCRPQIRYAYKVMVKSSAAEGDFMTYAATVVEVLKNSDKELEAVSSGTPVELVKRATCTSVEIQENQQYLLMGSGGSEIRLERSFRYRLPLDSEALLELWPTDCGSPECLDFVSQLDDFALDLQLMSCADAS
uniref:Complement component 5 n=1 Tax=Tetraodon nigroviridis TaxID=99883 RepID=H3CK04_TETNG